jgi:hypothetical protein
MSERVDEMKSIIVKAFRFGVNVGSGSVGATFQLAAKFGAGRSGGIEKTSLISLTSLERRARPHIW